MEKIKIKKILFVTRPLAPPWDEASKNFAFELSKRVQNPYEIHVMTNGRVSDFPKNVIQHPIFTKTTFTIAQKLRLLWFLFFNIRSFDMAHFLFTPTRVNARILRWISRLSPHTKTIQTIATLREDLYSPKTIKSFFFADSVVTYTASAKNVLNKLGLDRVRKIPPGIDLTKYTQKNKSKDFLEQFGFTTKHCILTCAGEYTRLGMTDFLVETIEKYFEKYPDSNARFLFAFRVKNAKDAAKKHAVKKRLRTSGIQGKIAFTDTIRDMPLLYNSSDIMLFPVENLHGKFDVPLVVPEGFICQKPYIVTNIKQFSEFTENALCENIEYGDIQCFIETIERLRSDERLRKHLGMRAEEYARRVFAIENIAKRYEDLYETLLESRIVNSE